MEKIKRYYIHPLIMLIIGVSFNVLSVVFMHIVARDVDAEIQTLSNEEVNIERRIDGLWSDVVRAESAINTALLLLRDNPELAIKYAQKSGAFLYDVPSEITADALLLTLKSQRAQQLEIIDDAFLDKLSKQQRRSELEAKNDQLMNIGLFLHMLGIVVILLMDVNRKHY